MSLDDPATRALSRAQLRRQSLKLQSQEISEVGGSAGHRPSNHEHIIVCVFVCVCQQHRAREVANAYDMMNGMHRLHPDAPVGTQGVRAS